MTLAIRLQEDMEARLAQLAEKTGRTKAYYVREAIARYLEDAEDVYIALARLEKPGKRWSMKDVKRELKLDH